MSFISHINPEVLQSILAQLDQALYNHQQWHNALLRTLICRLEGDKHDMSAEAFKDCRFGQWYYGAKNEIQPIATHPGFIAIGESHKHMHQLATRILDINSSTSKISTLDYDQFANALEQMRLEIFALKNELKQLLYNRDPLTGAINRINILQTLREQQEIVKRQKQPCCLAMIDLDLFKKINDQYGHLVGDKVLARVAQYFIENLRESDKVFRYGGEEFLICMPFTDLNQGQYLMDTLRERLASDPILVNGSEAITVTISIGITLLDEYSPVEVSIEHADMAMYDAKSAGRNCSREWKMAV